MSGRFLDTERDYWQPRVAVHFGAKLLKWAMLNFGQGTPRLLVVLNPTARKQTLRARLAAAYRAGELPDYMLEFVDSIRTRAKQPTS